MLTHKQITTGMGIKRRQFLLFGGTVFLSIASPRWAAAKSVREIRKIARQVTVKVITQGPSGSGVLIHKNGSIYTVLTAAHVVKNSNPEEEAYITTYDGETHPLNTQMVKMGAEADIAIATFSSDKSYRVTNVGKFKSLDVLDAVYVIGYPLADEAISVSTLTLTRGEVASIDSFEDGYGFSYTAVTKAGMSGGPVLDQGGQLIGIHGRAAGQRLQDVRIKDGLNLGIPVDTAIAAFGLGKNYQPPTEPPAEPAQAAAAEEPPPDAAPETPSAPQLSSFTFEVLGVDDQGQVRKRRIQSAQYYRQSLKDTVDLEMVYVPGGQFSMGSSVTEAHRQKNEGPRHTVTVPSFFMGKYPITQAQWQIIMGDNPSQFQGADLPVEGMSWLAAVEFCQKLSAATGQAYRLPSEAEWEYAARASTNTPFTIGKTLTTALANYDGRYTYGRGAKGTFRQTTTKVGTFAGNTFGLYDIHGQVWEWCQDHWHDTYEGAPTDGTAWINSGETNTRRVRRGGSWYEGPHTCRSAFRYRSSPDSSQNSFGLRVVCQALQSTSSVGYRSSKHLTVQRG
ncbi:Serine/threonine-protein kinase pkn1 [Acaryochloris thomasi RCC1774]|uniref:Serine/threonine-protein kinase pkn1 n=1 Tax=Acaryochloris thomasi RCC1774 TaxID=1764569 RepID=A0A2W1JMF7_9CYAN|nr:Serine/threonine-protein kinase pkn1 [Acaryochloris thomasi RCC1774]